MWQLRNAFCFAFFVCRWGRGAGGCCRFTRSWSKARAYGHKRTRVVSCGRVVSAVWYKKQNISSRREANFAEAFVGHSMVLVRFVFILRVFRFVLFWVFYYVVVIHVDELKPTTSSPLSSLRPPTPPPLLPPPIRFSHTH